MGLTSKTIQFSADTVVDVSKVGKAHIGQVQLRSADGSDPNIPKGTMIYYFPKGATIEVHDYLNHPDVLDVTLPVGPQPTFSMERPDDASADISIAPGVNEGT